MKEEAIKKLKELFTKFATFSRYEKMKCYKITGKNTNFQSKIHEKVSNSVFSRLFDDFILIKDWGIEIKLLI